MNKIKLLRQITIMAFLHVCFGQEKAKIMNEHVSMKVISLQGLQEFMVFFINGIAYEYEDQTTGQLQLELLKKSSFYERNLDFLRGAVKQADWEEIQSLSFLEKSTFLMNLRNLMMLDATLSPEKTENNVENWKVYEKKYSYKMSNKIISLYTLTNTILGDNDEKKLSIIPSLFYPNIGMPKLRPFNPMDFDMEYSTALQRLCKDEIQTGNSEMLLSNIFDQIRDAMDMTKKELYQWLSSCVQSEDKKVALYFASIERTYVPVQILDYNGTIIDKISTGPDQKIDIDVYIESQCADVANFVYRQLLPAWDSIKSLVQLRFVTFGKATVVTSSDGTSVDFQCQNGPQECEKNKRISCAMEILPEQLKLPFISCAMKNMSSVDVSECTKAFSLPHAVLEECFNSVGGSDILYANGLKTFNLKPKLSHVPTVTVDGVHSKKSLHHALTDFHDFVCETYSTKFKESLGISTPPGCKTRIQVHIDSIDDDVKRFFTNQFIPTWRRVGHAMKAQILPTSNFEIHYPCDRSTASCDMEFVLTCLNEMIPQEPLIETIICILEENYNVNQVEECVSEQGIERLSLNDCISMKKSQRKSSVMKSEEKFSDQKYSIEINGVKNATFSQWAASDLYLVVCDTFGMYDGLNSQGPSGCPVRVDVYMESLCPDTKAFFASHFVPAYKSIGHMMDVHIIPYGKADVWLDEVDGTYNFECQHGMLECRGNKVMSCIVEYLPTNIQVYLIACMLRDTSPAYAGEKCATSLSVPWKPIHECSTSNQSSILLYQNGLKTMALDPRLFFVPTITLNKYYDRNQLQNSIDDFHGQICDIYKTKTRNGMKLTPKGCKAHVDIFFDVSSKSSESFLSWKLPELYRTLHESINLRLFLVPTGDLRRDHQTGDYSQESCLEEALLTCAISQVSPEKITKFLGCYFGMWQEDPCKRAKDCADQLYIHWSDIQLCSKSYTWHQLLLKNQKMLQKYPSIKKYPALVLNGRHLDTTQTNEETDFQKIICSSYYNPDFPARKEWKPAGCRVSITVYTEASGHSAQRFFLRQLVPVWHDLKNIMDVTIIPFVKSQMNVLQLKVDRKEMDCPRDDASCQKTLLLSCITDKYSTEFQLAIISCLMENNFRPGSGEECVKSRGIAWSSIESCVQYEAKKILYKNVQKTSELVPKIFFSPTVAINGYYTKDDLRMSLRDLKSFVCKEYLSSDPEKEIIIPDACKVRVRVLINSLGIEMKEFFTFTLEQFARDFADIAKLEFIPLLGIQRPAGSRNCSSPQDPCYQSKLMACLFASHDVSYQMEFLACAMARDDPKNGLTECGQELLLDMDQMDACATSPKADAILRTILKDFPRKWVLSRKLPLVVVGKRVLANKTILSSVVCKNYGGITSLCPQENIYRK